MRILLILISVFSMISCSEDRLSTGPDDYTLGYDGPNSISPNLPTGQYELAAQYPSAVTTPLAGQSITSIAFYLYDLPRTCEIRVYGQGSPDQPGAPIYSANILSDLKRNRWNYHNLSVPVELKGEDVWVSIRFSHNSDQQTLGCDAGPRNINGDWSFFSSDNTWLTFRARTNADINWNIRCKVE
jgi:hypothetical protein